MDLHINSNQDLNKDEAEYRVCLECKGTGKIGINPCAKCEGRGVEAVIGGDIFYWDMGMSPLLIYQRNAHRLINKIINLVAMALSFCGVLCLLYYIFLVKNVNKIIANLFILDEARGSKANLLLLGFWAGVVIFMYLIYRIQRASERGTTVKKNCSYAENIKGKEISSKGGGEIAVKKVEISSTFTNDAIKSVEKAYKLVRKSGRASVSPMDLLIALMPFEKISIIFFRLGIDYSKLNIEIVDKIKQISLAPSGDYFLRRVLTGAYMEAYNSKKEKVDVEEILISLIKNDPLCDSKFKEGVINKILYELEVDAEKLINVVDWIRINEKMRKRWRKYRHNSTFKPKGTINKAMTAVATPLLDQYSQDLTILAKNGYLPLCIGREKELAAIFRIIESGRRGVVLSGNPGVGKNAIVEGIAQMMAAEDVPEIFNDKRLVSLSIARLISGAAPQMAMQRLLDAINEAVRSGNIILYINNIEAMIGISAGKEGSMDLSEVLVSAMLKYNLIVIAVASSLDYSKYIEQSSLVEIFKRVEITEPSDKEVIKILQAKTNSVEAKNEVYFSYGAIEDTVNFSKRYIHERFLPEKAISIIEEAGLFVKKRKGRNSIVSGEDIAELISQSIKIPLSKITEKEGEKLLNLEDKIHQRVVNQVEAVKAVADSLRRARVEFRDIKRPIANLMFLGPTGVGKTELAKAVAQVYFGSEEDMIRIDMSEYQNKDSIDRLIGAPDDYEILGILTESVRKRPFALLLLDEIEKAHPNILNLFLQVMDDGRLTDNRGRVIDFTNLIIIATSNAGTAFIQDEVKKETALDVIKASLINRELKMFFKPEFLNRFDGIIVFKPLTMGNVKEIAKLMMVSSARRMNEKGIKLGMTDEAIDWISRLGYDPIFGARPLRRAIQENIDTVLAKYLISGKVERGDTVEIGAEGSVKIVN